MPRFPLRGSGLILERRTHAGSFFDVVGRRSAVFGYENRPFEAWVYPLKVLDDFQLSFRLEGYPVDIPGTDVAAFISVRPEATVLTYSHAAFTVREVLYAPLEEPGIVVLLDIETVLPMTITGSFRPRLRLMWPAGLMTPDVSWDEKARIYVIKEETKRFVGIVGSPTARDVSVMPDQEEPRDLPLRFVIDVSPEEASARFVPIVIAGGVKGRDDAKAAYDRILASARALYEGNLAHYERLLLETASLETPDERLDRAFAWAKVGIDKGLVTNPLLGTGLVAGFRTSGQSERPGFAWLFGRDALWTALGIDSYGDFAAARAALEFLRKHQRDDGKIPHEVSQSASLIPWFTDYEYPWKSADATPLYVIAHADLWRASGDAGFLKNGWESVVKAWRFTAATDTDGNGLVENGKFGHGWVEGGPLHPAHEEIYLQGLWMQACRDVAEMAEALGEASLAEEARAWAERTRAAVERTYWIAEGGFYGFATTAPPEKPPEAEPGPSRARRQARMDELAKVRFVDEDTVLPAVPLWWRLLEDERAQSEIDHIGGGAMATDWGTRILSSRSRLYDPLSYHYGSVWPLFTGWAAMAAYRYGRPHVGFQALMANALLTETGALGYVTELLSGDFFAPFGRSSHHQVWSQAMVVAPAVRGMLGVEVDAARGVLTFAPSPPADWDRLALRRVAIGDARFDLEWTRAAGRQTIRVARRAGSGAIRLVLAPAFPLDARVRSATVDGRPVRFDLRRQGDLQRAEVVVEGAEGTTEAVFSYDEGADVFLRHLAPPAPGGASVGLRLLRSRADGKELRLVLEGRGGRTYALGVRTPRRLLGADGVIVKPAAGGELELAIALKGPPEEYVRREVTLPFAAE